ncbi:hypothetical protein CPC08DRAFT_773815, partial [Agrocybe pediades]
MGGPRLSQQEKDARQAEKDMIKALSKARKEATVQMREQIAQTISDSLSEITPAFPAAIHRALEDENRRLESDHRWYFHRCEGKGKSFEDIGRWTYRCSNKAHSSRNRCQFYQFANKALPQEVLNEFLHLRAQYDSLGSKYSKYKSPDNSINSVKKDVLTEIERIAQARHQITHPVIPPATANAPSGSLQLPTPPKSSPMVTAGNKRKRQAVEHTPTRNVRSRVLDALDSMEWGAAPGTQSSPIVIPSDSEE